MSEIKPILEPGRPGDLRVILETSLSELNVIRATPQRRPTAVRTRAIAKTTVKALKMWLGELPVAMARDDGSESQP